MGQQSVTKMKIILIVNWVSPKAAEAGLLNKISDLDPALGVTKFTNFIDIILVTLCCAA